MPDFSPEDLAFMQEALRLAAYGLNTTTPNPRVGCVLVKDGRIVGQGWHEKTGGPHAEIVALQDAGSDARGATAYVTLEPCSHYGRTGPCADALIKAGIHKVVAAMRDPNPQVSGAGLERLAAAGIATRVGLMEEEARELNIGFVSRMTRGRPWVRLKIAASLDGKTALADGQSQWITGEAARQDSHAFRARACAILTGSGTVLSDDPQLNVRGIATPRQPLKILLDSQLRIPPTARALHGDHTIIVHARHDPERAAALEATGAVLVALPDARMPGKIDLPELLRKLAKHKVNELHIEAGAKLSGALIAAGLADELLCYLAPSLLGNTALPMFTLPSPTRLARRKRLHFHDIRQIGEDLRILARFAPDDIAIPNGIRKP
ncbi:MAG: bifunctional diaminohydroxyphosphoribosylaminopyrimidine deaminase/5-amino-6-(5-phosphoribosylamino)uracil reductase RibD [Zoogloeaceae bacterium]|jgi:diaminohydroxyphosphoribosylaminopyrimidine deaminase/5-amino-6-(5-phosphoribosylamino)uracil reductase|nr:bifunctional diaminohydroxyphosphoribosylaminopyrimidine deaminase/5-amino-6-(5-phosphoribosylamino)uracil reductase RibD [Zoogloeaceae bacterium]